MITFIPLILSFITYFFLYSFYCSFTSFLVCFRSFLQARYVHSYAVVLKLHLSSLLHFLIAFLQSSPLLQYFILSSLTARYVHSYAVFSFQHCLICSVFRCLIARSYNPSFLCFPPNSSNAHFLSSLAAAT